MTLSLQVRLYTREYPWLCFRHAVQEANRDKDVKTQIDDYDVEYYLGTTLCQLCVNESDSVVIAKV